VRLGEVWGLAEAKVRGLTIEQWRQLARQGTPLPVTIPLNGVSMQPLIRRNRDLVTIIPLAREPRRGDVVLFEQPAGRFVVHRVRQVCGDRVQTLGDNCVKPDAWLDRSQVLGLAVSFDRDGRTIALDSDASRALGRAWMAVHPIRMTWRSFKSMCGRTLRKLGLRS
jgi:hypothetical protein